MQHARLGPYELRAELGAGGMATVYRAYQPNMARDVAVKVIYQELADAVGREQFQREARLIARLEHPHILPVYDFDGQSDPPYIVMRYLAGGTLKDALSVSAATAPPPNTPGTWRELLRWLQQVADALDYAHRQGIIHRDIKPSNIILDTEHNAFLADFGIALPSTETDTEDTSSMGTPFYAAPEQARGERLIGPAADLYSLGVVAFEMFTHSLPFEADSVQDLMDQHANALPPAASQRQPALPTRGDAVFARILAKQPGERYPTAAAFVEALSLAFGITLTHSTTLPAGPAGPAEQHKTVTAVYADVADLVAWLEEADNSHAVAWLVREFWERATASVAAHGGQILERAETELSAVWGASTAQEDDAERAVQVALQWQTTARALLQKNFADLLKSESPTPIRIGVHTGLALIKTQDNGASAALAPLNVSGSALTTARRLLDEAEGCVLISHDTFRAVRGVFDCLPATLLKIRGRKETLATYQVTAAKARAFRVHAQGVEGLEIRLIGRAAELALLQKAYLTAGEDRQTQAITVLGEAGVGKSRLLDEFDQWMELRPELFRRFHGRATPAMTPRPYALWRDVVSFRFEIFDDDPLPTARAKLERGVEELLHGPEPEMAHLMGYLAGFAFGDSPYIKGLIGDPKQLAARARQLSLRFFARLAAFEPMVIELEDLHYADEASLDLFNDLVTTHPDLPLTWVGLARPTLLERRPRQWAPGSGANSRLTLAPLPKRASRELAQELLQKIPDPPLALRDWLVERAEGNPLFMEELMKMLLEERVILRAGEGPWQVEATRLTHLRVPPTLTGVLQASLDTLLYPEKLTLQRAAVFGRAFVDTVLAALDEADEVHLTDLRGRLQTLEQRGFIQRRAETSFANSVEYTFRQALLRDLIYATLLEQQRRAYHTICARWLAQTERADEFLPMMAEHYEKAGDPAAAAEALEKAGDKAAAVSAFGAALQFQTRAIALVPTAARYIKQAEAHAFLSEIPAARAALQHVLDGNLSREPAERSQVTVAAPERATALAVLGDLLSVLGDYATANETLMEALPLARQSQHPQVLARVLYGLGDVNWRLHQLDLARTYLDESLSLAQAQGDTTRTLFVLNRLGTVVSQKDLNAAEVFFKEQQALALAVGNRERAMAALNNLGAVSERRADFTSALAFFQQALTLARELGARQLMALYLLNIASASITLKDYATARTHLYEGLALARELGTVPWVILATLYYADWQLDAGQRARALALMGMAQRHPAFSSDHRHILDYTLKRRGIAAVEAATELAPGATLDFDATVADILRDLAPDGVRAANT